MRQPRKLLRGPDRHRDHGRDGSNDRRRPRDPGYPGGTRADVEAGFEDWARSSIGGQVDQRRRTRLIVLEHERGARGGARALGDPRVVTLDTPRGYPVRPQRDDSADYQESCSRYTRAETP